MSLLGVGYVKWHYTNPQLPPLFFFYSGGGGGAWALVQLSYASAIGAARVCQPRVKACKFVHENGIF